MISQSQKEELKKYVDIHKLDKKHWGTSCYSNIKACEISSLYGLEGGNFSATLCDKEGDIKSHYIMGKECLRSVD